MLHPDAQARRVHAAFEGREAVQALRLFPHMKDSFWVAVAYGIVKQAEAMNVNVTFYEAGGYDNLPRQLSQFDDCIASSADAIIIGPSPARA